jgi:hypothetical protein
MITVNKSETKSYIEIKGKGVSVRNQEISDFSDTYQLVRAFSQKIEDQDAVDIINALKADRDLIAYGISLSGQTESDKITEIDGIIRQLSTRFIK